MIRVLLAVILTVFVGETAIQTSLAQSPTIQADAAAPDRLRLRLERLTVAGGAELLVITAQRKDSPDKQADTPLAALLRDTLGDDDPENDRLRYLWDFSYARPTWRQWFASSVPFFYFHLGSQSQAGRGPAPILLDLAGERNRLWRRWLWITLRRALLESQGMLVGPPLRAHDRNAQEHRQAHLIRALEIISLFNETSGARGLFADAFHRPADAAFPFSNKEMETIQARLLLAGKTMGELVDESRLREAYQKHRRQAEEWRGRNWELLRQRAETEGLYFEPLALPGGNATHAMLWIAQSEVGATQNERGPRRFNSRFLNISDPWRGAQPRKWKAYSETRWFDANNKPVLPGAPDARAVDMIPLALYGLEHPRIPILLADFRDELNPKRREASRRLINDVTRDLFSLSPFGNPYYFAGRAFVDFLLKRRGVDFNQPSRSESLAKLRLLLTLDQSISPTMRAGISRQMQRTTLNPLDNDWQAEAQLARQQYTALLAYARSDGGLPAQLQRDRRAEMTPLAHGRAARFMLRSANLLSFGLYTHRERAAPEMTARLDLARRLTFHQHFLREVAASGGRIEIGWDVAEVRSSLAFLAANSESVDAEWARLMARIFNLTNDEEARQLVLRTLSRSPHPEAITELRRLEQDPKLETKWRELCGQYLTAMTRPVVAPDAAAPAMTGKDVHQ